MNTKGRMLSAFAILGALTSTAADPTVEISSVLWNPELRRATVVYDLKNASAVVTADVRTNGVSVGGVRQWKVWGDVNRLMSVGNDKTLTWQVDGDMSIDQPSQLDVALQVWPATNPPPYLAVDVAVPNFRRYYASVEFVPQGPTNDIYRYDMILLRKIPAAGLVWVMGSPTTETGREPDGREQQRRVKLSSDYYIGVHEITQYQIAMLGGGSDTAHEPLDRRPPMPSNRINMKKARGMSFLWPADGHSVESSSVIGKLRSVSGISSFDLPTSAQWEYAARAGSSSRFYWGDDDSVSEQYEWSSSNTQDGRMRMGGLLKPSPWGLYDILGNNPELTLDWYENPAASDVPLVDPAGPANEVSGFESCKVVRGGRFDRWKTQGRSAFVNRQALDYDGISTFRPVCDAVAQ